VRLLAVSWDNEEKYFANRHFPPLMIVELAHQDTPTLDAYYKTRTGTKCFNRDLGFIADIADGLSALHVCGVIHGDLKPENILLFNNPEEERALIAKLCDFGFADVTFRNEDIRGESERWEAPERIYGCPQAIREAVEDPEATESASDVYSFGLVAMFIALDGVDPLSPQRMGLLTKRPFNLRDEARDEIEVAVRELKFSDVAGGEIEKRVKSYYSTARLQDLDQVSQLCQVYVSLIHDTLRSLPSKRIASLSGIRLRITGK
jgi:serine/threonine protein kinase